ncbi:MAG: NIPSNAP family protein [Gemmatimonadaceae bacterium]
MKPIAVAGAFCIGVVVGGLSMSIAEASSRPPAAADRVFELRTYTVAEGQLAALNSRFRDHTTGLFAKHGMTNIGYWTPVDTPLVGTTLTYLLAYPSREAATRSWQAFRVDTTWQRVRAATEAAGLRILRIESRYLTPTDYSAMK